VVDDEEPELHDHLSGDDPALFLVEPTGVVEWDLEPPDASATEPEAPQNTAQSASLSRAVSSMALGTMVSRGSGLLRVLVLAWALGLTPIADAFNLANQIPNMIFDLVLGGVVSATFVPVFIAELEHRRPKDAWKSISAVLTVSIVGLTVATVVCVAGAPLIVDAFTGLHHTATIDPVTLGMQRHAATVLLRWFVPQIFFYGLLALTTSLLNVHRIFAPPMWVPVVNNVICIVVLVLFAEAGRAPSLTDLAASPNRLLLLGAGTTAGVLAQALVLLPFLVKTDILRASWRFDLRDRAVTQVARLGAWTLGLVICNQIALFVILGLAFGLGGNGQVSAYSYAWIFFQTPYAIVSISVTSGLTPALASAHAANDRRGFASHFSKGLRSIIVLMVPIAVLVFVLAKPAMQLLLGLHSVGGGEATLAGQALAAFALGLPGFCIFQFVIRAFQTQRHGHAAFALYVVENALTIALAIALVGPLHVTGLALANSIAYSVTAVVGYVWLRKDLGPLMGPGTTRAVTRVLGSSLAMGLVAIVAVNLSTSTSTGGLLFRLGIAGLGASVTYGLFLALIRRYERPL